ncbi:MAG TPA: hypothetical protein VLL54_17805 [Pyrinomonadaceae bacterium]|nr:hypothetical protein [Pyrinomonadaceae bacterium]
MNDKFRLAIAVEIGSFIDLKYLLAIRDAGAINVVVDGFEHSFISRPLDSAYVIEQGRKQNIAAPKVTAMIFSPCRATIFDKLTSGCEPKQDNPRK